MTREICEFMSQPHAYPETTSGVQVIETHISWVFLTDRFVYKLKKPVRFDFLDFSTVEQRHDACQQELVLNRRLTRDVYLDVVPIHRDTRGRLRLGGMGRQPIDWTVKMKRLPADAALDQLIRSGRLETSDVDYLGGKLAHFYMCLPPLTVRTDTYGDQLHRQIRANSTELSRSEHGFDGDLVHSVHGAQLRFANLCQERLHDRVRDGRVVDGHGDLRPEHIYLTPEPAIIDCIEFNPAFRAIDVVDELAFLAMECDRLGTSWVGDRILASYSRLSGDRPDSLVIDFFKCYRACVRAKVTALRARQMNGDERSAEHLASEEYLRLAGTFAARLGKPLLLVVRGTSGTGKSTLASAFAEDWGATLLQTDAVRQSLFPADGTVADAVQEFGKGRYTPENRRRVYARLFQLAGNHLRRGATVILDGTFLSRDSRTQAMQLANECGAAVLLVECHCPDQEALERVRDRGQSASQIRPEHLARQRAENEPDEPDWPVCHVDTSEGLCGTRRPIEEFLKSRLGLCLT